MVIASFVSSPFPWRLGIAPDGCSAYQGCCNASIESPVCVWLVLSCRASDTAALALDIGNYGAIRHHTTSEDAYRRCVRRHTGAQCWPGGLLRKSPTLWTVWGQPAIVKLLTSTPTAAGF